jgi:tRNA(fMet)-specific endonuclease VapC
VRLLLDSNAFSALRRGHPVVTAHVARAEEVLLSVIVAGELLAGFRSGSRYDDNLRALQTLVKDPNVKVLQISWNTAEIFGRIASALRARGTPIPTNDIWLAAHAVEAGASLLSANRHFSYVEGLRLVTFSVEPR